MMFPNSRVRHAGHLTLRIALFGAFLIWQGLAEGRQLKAEVIASQADGFHIMTRVEIDLASPEAYQKMVTEFGQWWGGDHSFSGNGKNLSLDLEKHCMFEKLPDGGFVRHMEIAFHQPGKMLILRGGLGPLQSMGVNGALSIKFDKLENGKTQIELNYHVHGPSYHQLQNLSGVVNTVLEGQLKQLKNHLDGNLEKN